VNRFLFGRKKSPKANLKNASFAGFLHFANHQTKSFFRGFACSTRASLTSGEEENDFKTSDAAA
jgi:hypothetical protein